MVVFKKIDYGIKKITEVIIILSVLTMTVVLSANVFYRLFANKSIVSAEEIGRYCIIILTFVALAYVAQCDKHIKISMVFDAVPWKVKKALAIVVDFISAAIIGFVAYYSFEYVAFTMEAGRTSSSLAIPVYYVSIAVFIGFLLLAIEYFIEAFMNVFGGDVIYLGRTQYKKDEEDTPCLS